MSEHSGPCNIHGEMTLTVHKAKNMTSISALSTQDPQVFLEFGSHKEKSKDHEDGGKNPVWNWGPLRFKLDGSEESIRLIIKDKGVMMSPEICRIDLHVRTLFDVNGRAHWHKLKRSKKDAGLIQITATFTGKGPDGKPIGGGGGSDESKVTPKPTTNVNQPLPGPTADQEAAAAKAKAEAEAKAAAAAAKAKRDREAAAAAAASAAAAAAAAEEKKMAAAKAAKLVLLSPEHVGKAVIDNMSVSAVTNFPTVGERDQCTRTSGRHYYEVVLQTAGCAQIGWGMRSFNPPGRVNGVGDDDQSFSYDGSRMTFFHAGRSSVDQSTKWKKGDVVGCFVDLSRGAFSWTLNGRSLGEKYHGVTINGGVFPAFSLNHGQQLEIRLHGGNMTSGGLPGFAPLLEGKYVPPPDDRPFKVQNIAPAGRVLVQGRKVTGAEGFPTVAPRGNGATVASGTYYYEAEIDSRSAVQIGLGRARDFRPPGQVNGVGDDNASWSYDGSRAVFFGGGRSFRDNSAVWVVGQRVGVGIDFNRRAVSFYLNGRNLGDRFIQVDISGGVFPAVSLTRGAAVTLYFKRENLKYLPVGFNPYAE